jgi:pimeloyl-ACP methyl ester carboxylesterase
MRTSWAVGLILAMALVAAGSAAVETSPSRPTASGPTVSLPSVSLPAPAHPGLSDSTPCPDANGFACATLTVPLDHSGTRPGTLGLRVATAGNTHAPKGVLVFLTGGPGQPGEPLATRISTIMRPVLDQYRLVMIDQRGTGSTALQCPELQEQMGSSDLTAPTAQAVTDCAAALGPQRRYYSTADTVADLDQLRQALGVQKWTLDGVSYGTFTAERYALAHPRNVARLVLDSIVPQTGYDPLDRAAMRAVPRVLSAACAATACSGDPATDVATVVRRDHNGATLLDTLTSYEFIDPDYADLIRAIHASATGHSQDLDGIIAAVQQADAAGADQLSQGLHASTLCADGHYPWGTADTPVSTRKAALTAVHDRLTPADYGPFDADTATGLGSLLGCLLWPSEPVPPSPPALTRLPDVPVLLLGGDRDLSTPLEWLRAQQQLTPDARVVIVPGASHSVQSHASSDAGRQAVHAFLLDQ